ncbi:MAG: DUF4097 domain-containing protein [Lachnospiraceae bacterium]|nr:DUF4097 domain-containing protein [Lachnospiraceae bacterium]
MADEKNCTGWQKRYISIINAITVLCIIIGLMVNVFGWIGNDIINSLGKLNIPGIVSMDNLSDEKAEPVRTTCEAFKEIDGKLAIGNVIIKEGPDYGYSYENFYADEVPEIKVIDGELKINQKSKNKNRSNNGASVEITIPDGKAVEVDLALDLGSLEAEGVTFDSAEMEMNLGAIELKGVTAKVLDLDANMGAVDLKETEFGKGDIEASMGGISLIDVRFDSCKIDASMGGIDVSGDFRDLTAHCSMGGMEIDCKNENASMQLTAGMGEIVVDGKSVGRKYNR